MYRASLVHARRLAPLIAALLVAGCADNGENSAPVVYKGSVPATSRASQPGAPSGRIQNFDGYQAVIAGPHDTLNSMAAAAGYPPSQLSAYNGLPANYKPREGDILVLPEGAKGAASPEIAPTRVVPTQTVPQTGEIAQSDLAPPTTPASAAPPLITPATPALTTNAGNDSGDDSGAPARQPAVKWSVARATAAIDNAVAAPPLNPAGTHVVQSGETIFSIARKYHMQITQLAAANQLDESFDIKAGQVLILPPTQVEIKTAPETVIKTVPEPVRTISTPPPGGDATPMSPPPSSIDPLPASPPPPPRPLASPALAQYSNRVAPGPADTGAYFLKPTSGEISQTNSSKGGGIEFNAPVGAPVRAAGDGRVALVSQSPGGLGTIVLIKHKDNLMTVYGRVTGTLVEKGQTVARGQMIGAVAPAALPRQPALHFEVRRGADAMDPMNYL